MTFDVQQFRRLTTHSKVAFAIAIASPFVAELEGDARALAERGLALASAWQAGEAVSAEEVYFILMNDRDEGLLVYSDNRQRRSSDMAIGVISGVICYVSNHIYGSTGEHPPDGIDGADDDFLFGWLIDEVARSPHFDQEAWAGLYQHLSAGDEKTLS